MKKRILCLILTVLMLVGITPGSVLAEEIIETFDNSLPTVWISLSPEYCYEGTDSDDEYRALPDSSGTFVFTITLDKAPKTDEDIVVYYRTTDYGAVAEWMFAGMAGIRPDPERPGFEHIILSPRPDTRKAEEIPAGQERITMASANYRGIFSRWEYENGEFVWRFKIPNGSARVEFPLINGRKTVNINGMNFTKKELSGEIIGEKLVFELNEGEYIVK